MSKLHLNPGPVLIYRYDDAPQGERECQDVTQRAAEFLFERVTIDPAFTLGDLFRLLDKDDDLQHVFSRDYARALCAEARKGALPHDLGGHPAETAGIEYLELYRHWELDTSTSTYSQVAELNLHGIGPPVAEDAPKYNVKAGERIEWSVSLTPVRELLNLPLRVRDTFDVTEDDIDAYAYAKPLANGKSSEFWLGQVIHAVLRELSFYGTPEETAGVAQSLKDQMDEIDAGTVETTSGDDIFEELDRPGFAAMFQTLGDVPQADLRWALREVPDDDPMGEYLDRKFEGKVVVKPEFRKLAARKFRRALRAAGQES